MRIFEEAVIYVIKLTDMCKNVEILIRAASDLISQNRPRSDTVMVVEA